MKTVKCRYKYCPYGGLVDKEEAVKDGNQYYHKACWEEKEQKSKIRYAYKTLIDSNVNDKLLNKVISDIIHEKGISIDYLLFVVEYIANNNMKINSPPGLYYYIKDYTIQKQYRSKKIKEEIKKLNPLNAQTIETKINHYNIPPKKTWADILR